MINMDLVSHENGIENREEIELPCVPVIGDFLFDGDYKYTVTGRSFVLYESVIVFAQREKIK